MINRYLITDVNGRNYDAKELDGETHIHALIYKDQPETDQVFIRIKEGGKSAKLFLNKHHIVSILELEAQSI